MMFLSNFVLILCLKTTAAPTVHHEGLWKKPPPLSTNPPRRTISSLIGFWRKPPVTTTDANTIVTVKNGRKIIRRRTTTKKPGIWKAAPLTTKKPHYRRRTRKPGVWKAPPPTKQPLETPEEDEFLGMWTNPPPYLVRLSPTTKPPGLWTAPPPLAISIPPRDESIDESYEILTEPALSDKERKELIKSIWGKPPPPTPIRPKKTNNTVGFWMKPPPKLKISSTKPSYRLGVWTKPPPVHRFLPLPYNKPLPDNKPLGIWGKPPPVKNILTTLRPTAHLGIWKAPPYIMKLKPPPTTTEAPLGIWSAPPPVEIKRFETIPKDDWLGVWSSPPPYEIIRFPIIPKPTDSFWEGPPPFALPKPEELDWNVLHGVWNKTKFSYLSDPIELDTMPPPLPSAVVHKILWGTPRAKTVSPGYAPFAMDAEVTTFIPYTRENNMLGIWGEPPIWVTKSRTVKTRIINESSGIWGQPPPKKPVNISSNKFQQVNFTISSGFWSLPPPQSSPTPTPSTINNMSYPLGIWNAPPPFPITITPSPTKLYNLKNSFGYWEEPPPYAPIALTSAKPNIMHHGFWTKPPPTQSRPSSPNYWINPHGIWGFPPPGGFKLTNLDKVLDVDIPDSEINNPLGMWREPPPGWQSLANPLTNQRCSVSLVNKPLSSGIWSQPPPVQPISKPLSDQKCYVSLVNEPLSPGVWKQPPLCQPIKSQSDPQFNVSLVNVPLSSGIWSQPPPLQPISKPLSDQKCYVSLVNTPLSSGIWKQPPRWQPIKSQSDQQINVSLINVPLSSGIWRKPLKLQKNKQTNNTNKQTNKQTIVLANKNIENYMSFKSPLDLGILRASLSQWPKSSTNVVELNYDVTTTIYQEMLEREKVNIKNAVWGTVPPWRIELVTTTPLPYKHLKKTSTVNRGQLPPGRGVMSVGYGYTNNTNPICLWLSGIVPAAAKRIEERESFQNLNELPHRQPGQQFNESNLQSIMDALKSGSLGVSSLAEHQNKYFSSDKWWQQQSGKFGLPLQDQYINETYPLAMWGALPSESFGVPGLRNECMTFGQWGQSVHEPMDKLFPVNYKSDIHPHEIWGANSHGKYDTIPEQLVLPPLTERPKIIASFWTWRNFTKRLPGPTNGYRLATISPGLWVSPPPRRTKSTTTTLSGHWVAPPPRKTTAKIIVTKSPKTWVAPPPKRLPTSTVMPPRMWIAPPPKRVQLPSVTKAPGIWKAPPPERLRPTLATNKTRGYWVAPPPEFATPRPLAKSGVWAAAPPKHSSTPSPIERINKYASFWNSKNSATGSPRTKGHNMTKNSSSPKPLRAPFPTRLGLSRRTRNPKFRKSQNESK